jgi:hypothetical protein
VSWQRWLPEIVRSRPDRPIIVRYCALTSTPPTGGEAVIADALRAAAVSELEGSAASWRGSMAWRTLVYGLIRRDVDESLEVDVVAGETGWQLRVSCDPIATHSAHAAGAAGAVAIAGAVWLAAGWSQGMIPGLTTLAAGGLWTEVARVMALDVLERRLRRLASDLGSTLWPGVPAQILPPPRRLGRS